MSRSLLLPAVLLLAACSGKDEPPPVKVALEHIDCAIGGDLQLKPQCSVERIEREGVLTLLVRHPDGHTRNFTVTNDGTGLVPSDGARMVRKELVDHRLEVTIGGERYLFPATETRDAAR